MESGIQYVNTSFNLNCNDCDRRAELGQTERQAKKNNYIFVLPWAGLQYSLSQFLNRNDVHCLQNLPSWLVVFPSEKTISCIEWLVPAMLNGVAFANNSVLLCKQFHGTPVLATTTKVPTANV